jgi:cytochrome c553
VTSIRIDEGKCPAALAVLLGLAEAALSVGWTQAASLVRIKGCVFRREKTVRSGFMASIGSNWSLPVTVLAIVLGGSGRADDTIGAASPSTDLPSKAAYCKTCHGLSGQGYRGYYAMPRLAGQQTEYLERQLQDFAEGRRWNPVMFNVARVLDASMRSELAAHFRDLTPKPLGGAPRELMAMGKTIYEEGISDAGIAPCSSCHGPDAEGQAEMPRLAGQLYDYILKRFARWRSEPQVNPASGDTSAVMEPIAKSLTDLRQLRGWVRCKSL